MIRAILVITGRTLLLAAFVLGLFAALGLIDKIYS